MKKEFNDLINNLNTNNEATKSAIRKPVHPRTNNLKTTDTNILNPEKIGSLAHSAKRSKTVRPTKSDRGTKRTTISHLDKKQKFDRQQRISKKKSRISNSKKLLRKNATKRSRTSGRFSSKSTNSYLPYATPVRRKMDIHFMGVPSSNIDHYLLKEHQNLRKEFKSKRKNILKRRNKGRAASHKRERIQQSAMDIAKQDSMDSLYSFISKKVQEYAATQAEPAKKRDMNYYKHHIHNGK